MAERRCAVAILPAAGGEAARAARSVEAAARHGRGDFSDITMLPAAGADERETLAAAAEAAAADNFDTLLVLSAAETAVADLFVKAAPALRVAEALWGGAGRFDADGRHIALERITRLAEADYDRLFHLALRWWIGPAHFVPPRRAVAALGTAMGTDWRARYLVALWRGGSVMKTAQALTDYHGALPGLGEADRGYLLSVLADEPVFMPVHFGPHRLLLPYTGRNPVIEREHTRGRFFEADELGYLAGRLPRGLRIIDAGANTGNHTAFFAAVMEPASVVPLEPDPDAAAAIRRTVAANGLAQVDCRHLGIAVGSGEGQMRPVFSEGGGLGATRLVPDRQGSVPVRRLDDLDLGPADFLKIDVEGMEMPVLAGAEKTIARNRPFLFIEILDASIPDFLHWIDAAGYRIEKLFPDKTHCNYLLAPVETGRMEGH